MQVLKDELRHAMLKAAQNMFLDPGYEKTSMKDIAAKVGVSVGNLYRYFPNKEALLEAVTMPAYERLLELMENSEDISADRMPIILDQLESLLAEFLREYRQSLLILLYESKGTRQENIRNEFFDRFVGHVEMHFTDHNQKTVTMKQLNYDAARPLAIAFLEGYFEIIRLYSDEEQIVQAAREYVTIWFSGLQILL
ncbi:TetR/AcrR family transcriptional regulator [Paenibacillus motobuensis]|uniref:TetR/AcrR family transcriptional regulator n=1 Tax=Paenibacillus TaxID=44249 RepID=UPI00203E7B7E|nr:MULTISPECIES: TetR/AcrR family transcriptional regulator [Paenibacillus]MCM3039901.1 TetR/AcrR family transcriptional regulator [Paenibacillus lutimineralis]MCM3647005.1 TetR/AcrR family transcriptional regulator [Paenibacillus motobuensis]